MIEQLALPLGALPDRIVEVRSHCTACGTEIRNIEYPRKHIVESEYEDAEGRCFSCNSEARRRA